MVAVSGNTKSVVHFPVNALTNTKIELQTEFQWWRQGELNVDCNYLWSLKCVIVLICFLSR
jgi:hypothetical protein